MITLTTSTFFIILFSAAGLGYALGKLKTPIQTVTVIKDVVRNVYINREVPIRHIVCGSAGNGIISVSCTCGCPLLVPKVTNYNLNAKSVGSKGK